MTREEKNRVDECFDALSTVNSQNYRENEWVLLIDGGAVYHNKSEGKVLDYAEKNYPDEIPCLVKVPTRHPLTT